MCGTVLPLTQVADLCNQQCSPVQLNPGSITTQHTHRSSHTRRAPSSLSGLPIGSHLISIITLTASNRDQPLHHASLALFGLCRGWIIPLCCCLVCTASAGSQQQGMGTLLRIQEREAGSRTQCRAAEGMSLLSLRAAAQLTRRAECVCWAMHATAA